MVRRGLRVAPVTRPAESGDHPPWARANFIVDRGMTGKVIYAE
jgi:hypothetical protein